LDASIYSSARIADLIAVDCLQLDFVSGINLSLPDPGRRQLEKSPAPSPPRQGGSEQSEQLRSQVAGLIDRAVVHNLAPLPQRKMKTEIRLTELSLNAPSGVDLAEHKSNIRANVVVPAYSATLLKWQ
jgi:hypothetical protein